MACTTRSIFMKREPLTSTLATCAAPRDHGGVAARRLVEVLAVHGARLLAQRQQALDAALARVVADLGVEGRALVADLAHVAQHQQARARQFGQHVDGGAHGIGVGVVGVVDQRQRAAADGQRDGARAALDRLEGLQPRGDGSSGTPAASAQAAAASALRTLWRPAIWSRKASGPAGVPPARPTGPGAIQTRPERMSASLAASPKVMQGARRPPVASTAR
jgi:hypothetical protein